MKEEHMKGDEAIMTLETLGHLPTSAVCLALLQTWASEVLLNTHHNQP